MSWSYPSLVFQRRDTCGWSRRFCPTPGESWTTGMSISDRWSARPHAGKQQQVRRSDGPGRQDYLCSLDNLSPAFPFDLHAYRPLPVEQHAVRQSLGHDFEVRPVPRGVDVTKIGAPADSVGIVERTRPTPVESGVVMVRGVGESVLPTRLVPCPLVRYHSSELYLRTIMGPSVP